MVGSDATRAPARTDSSLASERWRTLFRRVRFRLLHGGHGRIADLEPVLRVTIPYLVIGFLLILAIARLVALIEERDLLEQRASEDLRIAASLMRAEDASLNHAQTTDPNTQAQILLNSALPAFLKENGLVAMVSDKSGRVVATTAGHEVALGREIETLVDSSQPLLVFGERAGVMPVSWNGDDAMASAALLGGSLGSIVLLRDEGHVFAEWRRSVSLNVTLFCVTALVLLAILVAYFRQATRAGVADRLLNDQHHRVETALSRGRCGLWDWDLARGLMFWSRSMYEMVGLEPRDGVLSFSEVSELLHPDDGSFFEFARQIASGSVGNIERSFRMRHVEGQYIWLRARAEIVRNPDNEIHLIGVAVDISENHLLAQMTDEANLRLQNAVENISETFVLWDADHRLVLCNTKYQEVFGLSDQDVRPGTPFAAVRAKARRPIEERKLTSPSFVLGERASETLLADGRWLQVSERVTGDGSHVSIGTDVTQLKVHQERLSDSERRLMATINDLSTARRDAEAKARQLADLNRNYMIEKERAESANQAKTTFLANMSHELRTPLNAIIGFSEIMREESFGPIGNGKYTEYAADIHQSGHYLLKLINDILDMSKIEAGRMALVQEVLDLPAILAEAIRIVEVPAASKSLDMRLEMPDALVLSGDRRATKQILLNLLANAVKFTSPGGEVRIRTRVRGAYAVITIVDNGIGIPRESLRNLGRPFEQVENELTRTHKGTGLGLAIARSLIELQGGSMSITSSPGRGTAVSFRLPYSDVENEPESIESQLSRAA
ncbi:PAS domain-containing sensor histidine kinase [Aureimonas sp. ME7]|uniref:PAS domain-containing sensor histidine kinase n=1 Tax=Aureimonas sp. ME7 TaxID=2744252 RepID=UPI0015F47CA7|nr:PAS domain-containing sensor histidine kinase [Aureimonas sp. ME7]